METPVAPGGPDQPATNYQPESPYNPAPPQKNNTKTILIIVLAGILLCCFCLALAAGAFAIYRSSSTNVPVKGFETAVQVLIPTTLPKPTATQSAPIVIPTKPTTKPQPSGSGLGVSRQEMIDYFGSDGAFEFEAPFTAQGAEVVMGNHTWLCVPGDCAAVTLLGPEAALDAISVAVPSDPDDESVGLTGEALLMSTAGHFAGDDSTVPYQIMEAIENARTNQEYLDTAFEDNGYTFMVSFDPETGIAGVGISR